MEILEKYFENLYKFRSEILSDEYPKTVLDKIRQNCGEDIPFYHAKNHFWYIYSFGENLFLGNFGEFISFYLPIVHIAELSKRMDKVVKILLKNDEKYIKGLERRKLIKPLGKIYMLPFYSEENYFGCYERGIWEVRCSKKVIHPKLKVDGVVGITPFAFEIYKLFYENIDIELINVGLESKGIVFLYFKEKDFDYINRLQNFVKTSLYKVKVGKMKEYVEAKGFLNSPFITDKLLRKFKQTKIYFNPYKTWFMGSELI
jgi:hypothetical protein